MLNIFITGASSGLGQALATAYAKQFASKQSSAKPSRMAIGLVGRRLDALQTLADDLKQYGVECAIYALDVRDSAALQQAAQDFIGRYGAPDIVIANAGVSSGTLTQNQEDIAAFQAVMDINVIGMVNTFQPFIAAMQARGQGQLVGISSVAGVRGLPGSGAYSASKAAATTYLESLRTEMQHHNIQVTCIAPGYVATPMTDINKYAMPFKLSAQAFANRAIKAIAGKRRYTVIPWQMGIVARVMRLIPPILWDLLTKNAPHKSRTHPK